MIWIRFTGFYLVFYSGGMGLEEASPGFGFVVGAFSFSFDTVAAKLGMNFHEFVSIFSGRAFKVCEYIDILLIQCFPQSDLSSR